MSDASANLIAPPRSRLPPAAVVSLLIGIEAVALTVLSRSSQPSTLLLFVCYGVAFLCYVPLVPLSRRLGWPVWVWFVLALALRGPWLATGLSLTDDAWRYLHDGRAQLAGINPFRYPPAAPEALVYAGPEHDLINNAELPTIYPPFAQLTFRVAAMLGATLLSWKLVLLVFDLGIGAGLIKILTRHRTPLGFVSAYLLHPLPIVEFAGNAHVDAVAICGLVWALALVPSRTVLGGAALAASIAAKYLSLPLAPFLARRLSSRGRLWLGVSVIGTLVYLYLPFTDPLPFGSLGTFARDFEFNGPIYETLATLLPKGTARLVLAAGLVALLGWMWHRELTALEASFAWIAAVLLVSPIVHPWYVTWLVPFFALRRDHWAVVWTGTVIFAYAVLPRWWAEGVWSLPAWAKVLEFAPVYGLLLVVFLSRGPLQRWRAAAAGDAP